ncbi:hypothetical protein AB1Y20_017878 [Prymnesium parvum]|uniref:Uncharacterized protein n=1 Tax=Prymnesium parvum TaxID=97485 RepID=A0AB34JPE2_PRYPA
MEAELWEWGRAEGAEDGQAEAGGGEEEDVVAAKGAAAGEQGADAVEDRVTARVDGEAEEKEKGTRWFQVEKGEAGRAWAMGAGVMAGAARELVRAGAMRETAMEEGTVEGTLGLAEVAEVEAEAAVANRGQAGAAAGVEAEEKEKEKRWFRVERAEGGRA